MIAAYFAGLEVSRMRKMSKDQQHQEVEPLYLQHVAKLRQEHSEYEHMETITRKGIAIMAQYKAIKSAIVGNFLADLQQRVASGGEIPTSGKQLVDLELDMKKAYYARMQSAKLRLASQAAKRATKLGVGRLYTLTDASLFEFIGAATESRQKQLESAVITVLDLILALRQTRTRLYVAQSPHQLDRDGNGLLVVVVLPLWENGFLLPIDYSRPLPCHADELFEDLEGNAEKAAKLLVSTGALNAHIGACVQKPPARLIDLGPSPRHRLALLTSIGPLHVLVENLILHLLRRSRGRLYEPRGRKLFLCLAAVAHPKIEMIESRQSILAG